MNKCLKIGLTGGIGSGKTTIAQIFSCLGIPVYYADDRAKYVMTHDNQLKSSLIAIFGNNVYKDAALNRPYLAQKVFNDDRAIAQLNQLVHPAVARDFEHWYANQHTPYIIKESALAFETNVYKQMDKQILVIAQSTIRMKRVMARDAYRTRDEIERIMKNQWTDEQKIPLASFVIVNDDQSFVLPQVLEIHRVLMAMH